MTKRMIGVLGLAAAMAGGGALLASEPAHAQGKAGFGGGGGGFRGGGGGGFKAGGGGFGRVTGPVRGGYAGRGFGGGRGYYGGGRGYYGGRGYGRGYGYAGAGLVGGLALGALAASSYPSYGYGYGGYPAYGAYDAGYGGECYWQPRRVWGPYGPYIQRVQVCY